MSSFNENLSTLVLQYMLNWSSIFSISTLKRVSFSRIEFAKSLLEFR